MSKGKNKNRKLYDLEVPKVEKDKEKEKEQFKPNRKFKPKNDNQADYMDMIEDNHVVLCIGPAGTGKTSCAIAVAVEMFLAGEISKIVITRPTVENGKGLGFLPGDLAEKYGPYVRPVIEELKTYFGREKTEQYIFEETFQFMPLEYVRGLTFKYSFVILDEAQNTTLEQLKMFLTRIGNGTTMVLNGDIDQDDLKKGESGFADLYKWLGGLKGVDRMEFLQEDIVRHPIIGHILKRLEDY